MGDALGAPVEFASLAEIRSRFGPEGVRDFAPGRVRPGAITDDTQMTLFTAEGLLRGMVSAEADDAADVTHREGDPAPIRRQRDRTGSEAFEVKDGAVG